MSKRNEMLQALNISTELARDMSDAQLRRLLRQKKRQHENADRPDITIVSDAAKSFFSYDVCFKARTTAQQNYYDNITANTVSFGLGSSGTGKTHVPVLYALEEIKAKRLKHLVCTRPNIQAGDDFGFLPGSLDEKYGPYMALIIAIISQYLPPSVVETMIQKGIIIGCPVNFLRGTSFNDSMILVDESQNLTPSQGELILGRVGNSTKVVVNGDYYQCDIVDQLQEKNMHPGIIDMLIMTHHMKNVGVTVFKEDDIVRSDFAADVIKAYNKRARAENEFVQIYNQTLAAYIK